jgi:hypothetical protein
VATQQRKSISKSGSSKQHNKQWKQFDQPTHRINIRANIFARKQQQAQKNKQQK